MKTKVKMQIHGKLETEIERLKELQEQMGILAENHFKCNSVEELDTKMSEMTLLDLQKMAISVGIPAGGDRRVLKNKIRTAFEKFVKGGHGYAFSSQSEIEFKGKDAEKRKESLKILMAEGI